MRHAEHGTGDFEARAGSDHLEQPLTRRGLDRHPANTGTLAILVLTNSHATLPFGKRCLDRMTPPPNQTPTRNTTFDSLVPA